MHRLHSTICSAVQSGDSEQSMSTLDASNAATSSEAVDPRALT